MFRPHSTTVAEAIDGEMSGKDGVAASGARGAVAQAASPRRTLHVVWRLSRELCYLPDCLPFLSFVSLWGDSPFQERLVSLRRLPIAAGTRCNPPTAEERLPRPLCAHGTECGDAASRTNKHA